MAVWKNVQIHGSYPKEKKKAWVHTLIFVFDQASTLAVVGFKSTSSMHAGLCQIF
jgi:hypothetical protein